MGVVATMMDEFTREENKAMNKELERNEDAMLRMAGEIATLTALAEQRADEIADLATDRQQLENLVHRHERASIQFQHVVTMYNNEINGLIPERNYEHRLARDRLGVVFPVMMGREVIDLTADEEIGEEDTEEEIFEETLAILRDQDI